MYMRFNKLFKKRNKDLPRFITKNMAEQFDRKIYLQVVFWETILYFIFVLCFTKIIMEEDISTGWYLTNTFEKLLVKQKFVSFSLPSDLAGLRCVHNFWQYLDDIFIVALYADLNKKNPDSKHLTLLTQNHLLGVPRMRQVKVRNNSCIIHKDVGNFFTECFNVFEADKESTESFGLKTAPEWVYSSPEQTESIGHKGRISSYTGGGFYYNFPLTKEKAIQDLKMLKENDWITAGTRAIFIDFTVYNINMNMFLICKLVFEFPPVGGIRGNYIFRPVKLLFANSIPMYRILENILIGFYILRFIRQAFYFKKEMFKIFWIHMGIIILSLCIIYEVIYYRLCMNIDEAMERVSRNEYGNFEYLSSAKTFHNDLGGCLLFFIYLNIFEYLNFNKTMSQFSKTIDRCAVPTVKFLCMFFIVFFSYAELGYLLFGNHVKNYRSIPTTMITLINVLFGNFYYFEIEQVNRVLAPIYFLSYLFLIFMVLLNIFLGIVTDSFADVKTELAITRSKIQLTDYVKQIFQGCFAKLGFHCVRPKNEEDEIYNQIREVLEKTGFSPREIEMFFTKYEIDPEHVAQDPNNIVHQLRKIYTIKYTRPGDTIPIDGKDFASQDERIDDIFQSIKILGSKVGVLVQRLNRSESLDSDL